MIEPEPAGRLNELSPRLAMCILDREGEDEFHTVNIAPSRETPREYMTRFTFGFPEQEAFAHQSAAPVLVEGAPDCNKSVWGEESDVKQWFIEHVEACAGSVAAAHDGEVAVTYSAPPEDDELQFEFSEIS